VDDGFAKKICGAAFYRGNNVSRGPQAGNYDYWKPGVHGTDLSQDIEIFSVKRHVAQQ
jgi:hypothetical protein